MRILLSPNPAEPTGTTSTAAAVAAPTSSNDDGGGLFQDNPHVPAGATTDDDAPPAPAAAPAGATADPGADPAASATTDDDEPASNLSRDDIVDILREAGLGTAAQPAPAAAPEPTLTEEQFEKMFNVFKGDENLVKALTDESPAVRIKAISTLRDGLIKQAMTMTEYRMKQHLDKLVAERVEPLQTYVSQRQATEFRDDFFKKYPDLTKYELIVEAVSNKLQAKGFQAESREKVMERFATDARAAVKALLGTNGAPAPDAPTNGTSATAGGKPKGKMSTLSSGGHGGQSRPGGSATGSDQYKGLPANVAAGLAALD